MLLSPDVRGTDGRSDGTEAVFIAFILRNDKTVIKLRIVKERYNGLSKMQS